MFGPLASTGFGAEEATGQQGNEKLVKRDPVDAYQSEIRRPYEWQGESQAVTPSANTVSPGSVSITKSTLSPGSVSITKSTATLPSSNSTPASSLPNSNQASAATIAPSVRAQNYKLASGDTLAIKVFNYKDLSGEYLVRYDGSISVPVLGSLQVAGLEISDVERLLSERFSKISHGQSYVSVVVSRYRPFYVVGFVDKPGAYAWQPGLSVLHALTLSGGFPRIDAASPVLGDREIGELGEKLNLLKRALIRRARLSAERDNKTKIIVPARLHNLVNDVELDALVSLEQRNLAERLELMKSKRKNFEQAITHAREEISSLKEKQVAIEKQIDLQTKLAVRLRKAPKGIVQNTRFMEVEISLAEFVAGGRDIVKEIAIAKQRLSDAEHGLKTFLIERRIEIDGDLNRLDLQISAYNKTIATSNSILARMGSSAGGGASAFETNVTYSIVRKEGSKATTLKVDEFASVLPGDILRVQGSFLPVGGSMQREPLAGAVGGDPLQLQEATSPTSVRSF
ncbi:MAG: polysaccharide biosynthesis/export family protein [Hyphomicrobiaceae bacterium]